MLDLRFVADNIELVQENLKKRNSDIDLTELKELSWKRRKTIQLSESLKAEKNKVSSDIALLKKQKQNADDLILKMREKVAQIKDLDSQLQQIEEKITDYLYNIPNMLDQSVPYGTDDSHNQEIRKWSKPREFDFEVKPHWEIGEQKGILNFSQSAKISGARFAVYHGDGARLERALVNFMLDTHLENGYQEVFPPFIVNKDSMTGTGQLPKFEDGAFKIKDTDYYLIPTAEVPVTNLHRNEILPLDKLPIKYCAYSACFRSEAGSAGRDTRGLIRLHQFNKVELVKFSRPETSYEELESLTQDAERILQRLELPYRVVALCSGDVGFSSAKTYDLEVYMPSYGRYVEISSCSNFTDYQARRANIKYKDESGKNKFAHTLNGSGLAVGRTVAAILENYQQKDGRVTIPQALVKYMGCDSI
ncbi:MAG: serine--tRNA ligase [Bacillota bacterium]|jgi:seryl-tRNA synthetase|nr:serine--tRNA ligase [Bacillota bacterium]HHU43699.1 serine--tRNA ligase [Clostridiales bacterium]